MDIHEFDEQLNTIKAFHSYLSDIIDKGYNNNQDIIKLIAKNINEYIEQMEELEAEQNESEKDSDETESDENESDETESEDDNTIVKQKIQSKMDKFLNTETDLSKIYLYQKDNKYISELNEFINNSYFYGYSINTIT